MATTVAYAASMCTRKTNSSSNAKNGVACQEFYDSSYNYVGVVCFSGMNLANKVITGIWLSIDAARAGYGAGSTKTVYMRKANYQNSIASGVTGSGYAGNALGTFDGSFFGNSTVYQMTGTLFNNMAAYISQGNNTFTIYNPSPGASSQGYSYNYLQWTAVTITITYEEAVSQPSTSASSVNMGSAVTVYTNRVSTSTTHTLLYTFGNTSGTIATNVGASVSWTPPLTLAAQIPSATNGVCTITCQSYNGGTLTGHILCDRGGYQLDSGHPDSGVCQDAEHAVRCNHGCRNLWKHDFFLPNVSGRRDVYHSLLHSKQEAVHCRGCDAYGHSYGQPGSDGDIHHDLHRAGLQLSVHHAVQS